MGTCARCDGVEEQVNAKGQERDDIPVSTYATRCGHDARSLPAADSHGAASVTLTGLRKKTILSWRAAERSTPERARYIVSCVEASR